MIISNATAPPLTHVTKNIVKPTFDHRKLVFSMKAEVIIIAGHVIWFGAFFCTLIPSYELWTNVFDPNSIWVAIPALACALGLQTLSWTLVTAIVQWLFLSSKVDELYCVYNVLGNSNLSGWICRSTTVRKSYI